MSCHMIKQRLICNRGSIEFQTARKTYGEEISVMN